MRWRLERLNAVHLAPLIRLATGQSLRMICRGGGEIPDLESEVQPARWSMHIDGQPYGQKAVLNGATNLVTNHVIDPAETGAEPAPRCQTGHYMASSNSLYALYVEAKGAV
jgi:hypothetical protein